MKGFLACFFAASGWVVFCFFFFPPVCICQEILNFLSWFWKFGPRELSNFSALPCLLSGHPTAAATCKSLLTPRKGPRCPWSCCSTFIASPGCGTAGAGCAGAVAQAPCWEQQRANHSARGRNPAWQGRAVGLEAQQCVRSIMSLVCPSTGSTVTGNRVQRWPAGIASDQLVLLSCWGSCSVWFRDVTSRYVWDEWVLSAIL